MKRIITDSTLTTMTNGMQQLQEHFEKMNPGTEICIFYKSGVYHIMRDGKLFVSQNKVSIQNLMK